MKPPKTKPAKAKKGVVQKQPWYQTLDNQGGKRGVRPSKAGGKKSANKSALN